jgi:16S rRNA (guanine527-N7)-methyltransferase
MQILTSPAPSSAAIQRAASEFQIKLDSNQMAQIQQYTAILLRWNAKTNLTAIVDPLEILYRHFCESMLGSVVIPAEKCRLADVGSGAGFPGLPMKIFRPELDLYLIESNLKKATFLTEVIRELGLTGVRVLVSRYEALCEEIAPLDIVCSRAVGEFAPFLEWAATPGLAVQKVALWVGAQDADLIRRLSSWEWQERKPIPHSLRRFILVGDRKKTAE